MKDPLPTLIGCAIGMCVSFVVNRANGATSSQAAAIAVLSLVLILAWRINVRGRQ